MKRFRIEVSARDDQSTADEIQDMVIELLRAEGVLVDNAVVYEALL